MLLVFLLLNSFTQTTKRPKKKIEPSISYSKSLKNKLRIPWVTNTVVSSLGNDFSDYMFLYVDYLWSLQQVYQFVIYNHLTWTLVYRSRYLYPDFLAFWLQMKEDTLRENFTVYLKTLLL